MSILTVFWLPSASSFSLSRGPASSSKTDFEYRESLAKHSKLLFEEAVVAGLSNRFSAATLVLGVIERYFGCLFISRVPMFCSTGLFSLLFCYGHLKTKMKTRACIESRESYRKGTEQRTKKERNVQDAVLRDSWTRDRRKKARQTENEQEPQEKKKTRRGAFAKKNNSMSEKKKKK